MEIDPFDQWKTLLVRLKYWPVAYNMQPTIEAALQMREAISSSNVTRVIVEADSFSYHISGSDPEKWQPTTSETADHSLPYVFARAMVHGVIDRESFDQDALTDPRTRELMGKVDVVEDKAAEPDSVRVEVQTASGDIRELRVRGCPGHQTNPLTREQLAEKFRGLVEPALGEERAAEAFELAMGLPVRSTVDEVLRAFDVETDRPGG
jgi:2-methylcitrate dehydratase